MNLPIDKSSTAGLLISLVLGLVFGVLLHRGQVTNFNVIVNFFRLKDMTVLKVMLTAILVGGLGVWSMMGMGWLQGWHIKDANLLGVGLGAAIFGVGMAIYGYCPGTGVAAAFTGSLHAMVGIGGMVAGGIAYALSYPWVGAHILPVGALGKVQLTEVMAVPSGAWWMLLVAVAGGLFWMLERNSRRLAHA